MFRVYEVDDMMGVAQVVAMFASLVEADAYADEAEEACDYRLQYQVVRPEEEFFFL